MRRVVMTSIVLCVILLAALPDARGARTRHGGASGARSGRGTRLRADPDGRASAAQCDSARGAAAYGSTARCLHALCAGQNVTNAYVLDRAHRLQRNPCAGVDPFDRDR
jgi:hypothetical protein